MDITAQLAPVDILRDGQIVTSSACAGLLAMTHALTSGFSSASGGLGNRPTSLSLLRRPSGVFGRSKALRILKRPPQQKLDLPVQAAKLIIGPPLQLAQRLMVDPEKK